MKLRGTVTPCMAILFLALLAFSCKKTTPATPVTPPPVVVPVVIDSISPLHGPGGTVVTIKGSGFNDTTKLDTVYFNGNAAVVTSASDTALQVTVPMTAGTGNVTVTVKGSKATGPSFTYDYQGVVSTYAGSASDPGGAANGNRMQATFSHPWGIAVDGSGDLYIADFSNNMIRMIDAGGTVSTLLTLPAPAGLALDGKGSLYVSENDSHSDIFQVALSPPVASSTLSGNGTLGFQNSSPGQAAEFNLPAGLAIGKNGNVYVADQGNDVIRLVTPAGVASTFCGIPTTPGANNTPAKLATFNLPSGLVFDNAGNCYVADRKNAVIRKIATDGTVSTFAGSGTPGHADGADSVASFMVPTAITIDSKGNLYVADIGNSNIRMITPAGTVTTIAGSSTNQGSTDGIGAAAAFFSPDGIACDANGTLWVTDGFTNTIRKITLQ